MTRIKKIILCTVTILLVSTVMTAFEIIHFGESSTPKKSDCIIVLGCQVYGETPSPFLQWRTEEGLRLLKEGYGKYIIVSGGKGPGENISEAEAMKRYLLTKGVDSSKIIMEDKSASTIANLINSKDIMKKNGLNTAVIVSNKYHLKRASLMAKHEGINATYSGVFVSPYKKHEIVGYIREIPALIKYYLLKGYFKIS